MGEIQSAQRVAGEWRVRVKPAVDFASLETVLVVLKAPDPPSDAADDGER